MTLDIVSTTKRTVAVSAPTSITIPARPAAPSALPTAGIPTRRPWRVPASMPTSQLKFDGSRLTTRTGRSSISSCSAMPSSSRSCSFSRAASVSSAMRCSAAASSLRSSSFSARSEPMSPTAPAIPATPPPRPETACRSGSSARLVAAWNSCAGSVRLASSMSRLRMVNVANQRPACVRRCGLPLPYMVPADRSSARRARVLLADQDALEGVEVLEDSARPANDTRERVVRDVDRHLRRLRHAAVEADQQRAAAGEHDALVHDVGHQLRRCLLDGLLDRVDNVRHRRFERLPDLVAADLDAARQPGQQVPAAEGHGAFCAGRRMCRPDRDLDLLGGPLAHQQVVLTAREADDIGIHLVSADPD